MLAERLSATELLITLDSSTHLNLLQDTAEDAGVSLSRVTEAMLINFNNEISNEFTDNPDASQFRELTEGEVDEAILAMACGPEESARRTKDFLNAHFGEFIEEDRESIAQSMQAMDAAALEMKKAYEDLTTNVIVH